VTIDVAADLAAIYESEDLTKSATFGAETAPVLFTAPDITDVLGGAVQSTEYAIRFPKTQFSGIAEGNAITVAGIAYTVRGPPRLLPHGYEMMCELTKT